MSVLPPDRPCPRCRRLGATIQDMQRVLTEKNKVVDRLLQVWCSGGCEHGTGRFTDVAPTEDDVVWAERYAVRLRARYESRKSRLAREAP